MIEVASEAAKDTAKKRGFEPQRVAEATMETAKFCGAGPLTIAEIGAKQVKATTSSLEEAIKMVTAAIVKVESKDDNPAVIVSRSASMAARCVGASQAQAAKAAAEAAREVAVANGKNAAQVGEIVAQVSKANYVPPFEAAHEAGVAAAMTAVGHG